MCIYIDIYRESESTLLTRVIRRTLYIYIRKCINMYIYRESQLSFSGFSMPISLSERTMLARFVLRISGG